MPAPQMTMLGDECAMAICNPSAAESESLAVAHGCFLSLAPL
jgi:hypothetical protein